MRNYIQSGKGSPFFCKKDLLNIFELYLSDLSQRIVTIVFPGPSSCARRIAPATLIPEDPPRQSPSSFKRSKQVGRAS